jgi:thiol:disulfide interchange protein DsbC
MALFSDPMCQHCIVQEKELARITNVTVYTFLYPIERLHKGATARAQAVWCSKDRAKAWDDLMLSRIDPKAKPCRDPVRKIEEVGTKLKVDVTPTLIFGDGTVVSGGIIAAQVEKLLDDALRNPQ